MIKFVTSLLELCNDIMVLQKYHETHPFSSFPQESIKQQCEVVFQGIGKIIKGSVNGGWGPDCQRHLTPEGLTQLGGPRFEFS